MKRVLFLTSNNLATNPRLLKELTLGKQYFHCTLISFHLANWSDPLDKSIRDLFHDVSFEILPTSRKPFLQWVVSSFIERLSRTLYPFFKRSILINALAHSKRSFLLNLALRKHKDRYDLVIAHNLATLFPAYKFASAKNIPFAFDIEDFHPGEKIEMDKDCEVARRRFLMQKLLPYAHYFSYASPLIGLSVIQLVPQLKDHNYFLLNNAFPRKEFTLPIINEARKLSFVWFSQNIAAGRGLEAFIPILYEFKDDVELTLIGSLSENFYCFMKGYSEIIKLIEPLPQTSLHKLLAKFDVGLAIESVSADYNRDLCLTNKIFAYAQAGLYVLATNTKGQTLFLEQNPWAGELVGQTPDEIRCAVRSLIKHNKEIREKTLERYEKNEKLSWEYEGAKLINVWKTLK